MIYPLKTMYITSKYGMRRHPVFGYDKMHLGVDLRAKIPTETYSVLDGVVKVSKHQVNSKNQSTGLGNYIVIEHELNGEKFCTMVCHLSKRLVKVGQKVKEGQLIAMTGNTGSSSAPHLHFGIHYCEFDKFFTYQYQKSGIHTYREFKHTINPIKFLDGHTNKKKGENMGERITLKFIKDGKEISDLEKKTIEALSGRLDAYREVEPETVYYEYCGRVLKYGMWSSTDYDDVLKAQKAINQLINNPVTEDGMYGNEMKGVVGNYQKSKNIYWTGEINESLANVINNDLKALNETPVEPEPEETVQESLKKTSDHHKGKLYNVVIPQLKYRKQLKFGKGRVFKSTEVKYWQKALQSCGYYRDFSVDGWFGTNCINETIRWQQDYGLPTDNSLDMLDYYKMNQCLINNIDAYYDTEYKLDNWGIGINSKYVGVAVKVNPSRLEIVIGDKAGNSYTEDNLMTSSYQWLNNGIMYKYGVCIDDYKILQDGQVHNKPVSTLYSKGGKHFDIKQVLYANELGYGVKWADNGLMMYPNPNEYKTGGFYPKYTDVLRTTARPMHMKYNGELYFVVMPDMNNKEAYQYGLMIVAGWIVSEDAGGSTLLKVLGKWYWKTSRRLYQLIKF